MELRDSEKRREVVSVCLFVALVLKVESKVTLLWKYIHTKRDSHLLGLLRVYL